MMNFSTKITAFTIIIPLTFLILSCGSPQKESAGHVQTTSSKANDNNQLKDAPDFTLQRINGESFTLSDHEGQIVVLNFWATWCAPCRKEIPDFMEMSKELSDEGVLFVGVSLDKEGWSKVRPYANNMNINYPIMVDNGSVSQKYGPIRAIPTTFIINREGKVEYVAPGMLTKEKLKPLLVKLANR